MTEKTAVSEPKKSFIGGLRQAAEHIHEYDPHHLMFPMLGSIPFSDVLNIVDTNFDAYKERSEYVPASISRGFRDDAEEWLANFIGSINPSNKTRFMFVDEAVSGNCVRSLEDVMQKAIGTYAESLLMPVRKGVIGREKHSGIVDMLAKIDEKTGENYVAEIRDIAEALKSSKDKNSAKKALSALRFLLRNHYANLIDMKTVSIEHLGGRKIQHGGTYDCLVKNGKVLPVKVSEILTMDNPDLTPAKYLHEHGKYQPIIESISTSQKYMEMLRSMAEFMGADISQMQFPVNGNKILDSKKYLNRFCRISR